MQPECSTATTRPGKGPGMPGFEVEALLWIWSRATVPARAAERKRSRRWICIDLILQGNEFEGFQEFTKARKVDCVPARTPPFINGFINFIGFLGFGGCCYDIRKPMCMPNRLWIALVMILPAVADPAMTFKATNAFEVLAEGEITPDTPAAFTDFLKHNGTFRQTVMFNS